MQRFPESEVMRCPGKEAIEAHFMSAVKEVIVEYQGHKLASIWHFLVKHSKIFMLLACIKGFLGNPTYYMYVSKLC